MLPDVHGIGITLTSKTGDMKKSGAESDLNLYPFSYLGLALATTKASVHQNCSINGCTKHLFVSKPMPRVYGIYIKSGNNITVPD